MIRRFAIGLTALTLGCLAPRPESAPPDLSAARAQIDTIWTAYRQAALAGDVEALVKLYTPDAHLIESGLPTVRGDSAFRSVVTAVLAGLRFLDSKITPDQTELAGDRVLQSGTYRDELQPAGQPVQTVHGRYLAVFQRDGNGVLRISQLVAVADSTIPLPSSAR